QTAGYQPVNNTAITGIFLKSRDPSYKLTYDCTSTGTPPARPCTGAPGTTSPSPITSLTVTPTATPPATIEVSCQLYDTTTKTTIQTNPAPYPIPTDCKTTGTQQIVGVQIAIQPPPLLQLSVFVGGKWENVASSPDKTDWSFETVEFESVDNAAIAGISLTS